MQGKGLIRKLYLFSPEERVESREGQTSIWFKEFIHDKSDSSAVIYQGC